MLSPKNKYGTDRGRVGDMLNPKNSLDFQVAHSELLDGEWFAYQILHLQFALISQTSISQSTIGNKLHQNQSIPAENKRLPKYP